MNTDVTPIAAQLYYLPVKTRVPLKFGPETLTSVTCARVCLTVQDRRGNTARGWGEIPLSVQWAWPSTISLQERTDAMQQFCNYLTEVWGFVVDDWGHPLEIGYQFQDDFLPGALKKFNLEERRDREPMPHLVALICNSAFDIALHDAYGNLLEQDVYTTYNSTFMNHDLSHFLTPAEETNISFAGKFPADFLVFPPPRQLPAWHLVGGMDLLDESELAGSEPDDGYPVLLPDWIQRDGLTCLKVKLRGNDADWDYDRLVKVGAIALEHNVLWLTSDFNCTVTDPAYVNDILDRLMREHPRISDMILYVEQPFPYDLQANQIDVHSVSARKPLFMDESAHDWKFVKLGRTLGWTGVALKTCKTQTGALLSLCWAKAHGMKLMVQDLTNPMIAQIPHVRLAAHAGTIMGVETNAMQFYPAASKIEANIHPGIFQRRNGQVDLSTLHGTGFGYRLDEINRQLPPPAASFAR